MAIIKRLSVPKIKRLGLSDNEAPDNSFGGAKKLPNNDLGADKINEIEIRLVRLLFMIRNANYYGRKNGKDPKRIIPYYFTIGSFEKRERVFIAGKIFSDVPVIKNIIDADASKIGIRKVNKEDAEKLVGSKRGDRYNAEYIDIDGGKIKIFLPLSYGDNDFPRIMLDFLTNGPRTMHTVGGEFPDYLTYKLALGDKAKPDNYEDWTGKDGCWLTDDRDKKTVRWYNAVDVIIKNKMQGRLGPFMQIAKFYEDVDEWIMHLGHQVKWCKGAKTLVKVLGSNLDGGNLLISNDVEVLLSELNLGICDYAITKFHELIYGRYATDPLQGIRAYDWDKAFVEYEQGVVAVPIYAKTSGNTIKKFQDMADRAPRGWHGTGALVASPFAVIPKFNSFSPPGLVTDAQFRIDLPLLMLYIETHKPRAQSFVKHLNIDGTLNEEYKSKIRKYAL